MAMMMMMMTSLFTSLRSRLMSGHLLLTLLVAMATVSDVITQMHTVLPGTLLYNHSYNAEL